MTVFLWFHHKPTKMRFQPARTKGYKEVMRAHESWWQNSKWHKADGWVITDIANHRKMKTKCLAKRQGQKFGKAVKIGGKRFSEDRWYEVDLKLKKQIESIQLHLSNHLSHLTQSNSRPSFTWAKDPYYVAGSVMYAADTEGNRTDNNPSPYKLTF